MLLIIYIFYISLFFVFYTYIGYGLLLYTLLFIKKRFMSKSIVDEETDDLPEVTLFISAYNEESIITEKMQNCYKLNYPKEKLKILWITDGSNDSSNDVLKQYDDIIVFFDPIRRGKTAAINRGMKFVITPITIFTDANTLINSNAILEIVSCFKNKNVGCVAGEKRITNNNDNITAANEGLYWKYESALKKMDYELNSVIGAAGELYAIKTSLFEKIPENMLLDDFILSMKIAMKGFKIAYCEKAYATERGSANINEEEKRKIRIAAGGVQSILFLKELFNIFKFKILSFQYISHRVLRWTITPICLIILLPINIYLAIEEENYFYTFTLLFQIIFYLIGIVGWINSIKNINNKYINIFYYFIFMNLNVIKGFVYLMDKNKCDGTWEKSVRA